MEGGPLVILGFSPLLTCLLKKVSYPGLLQNRDFIEYSLGFQHRCLTSQKNQTTLYSTSFPKLSLLLLFRSDIILRFSQYFIATSTTKLSKLASTASLCLHNSKGCYSRPFIKSATVKIAARLRVDCSKPTLQRPSEKKTL